jgi:hypothetical protein
MPVVYYLICEIKWEENRARIEKLMFVVLGFSFTNNEFKFNIKALTAPYSSC